jgi:hypothetical protein
LRIAGGTQPLHPLQIIALTDVQQLQVIVKHAGVSPRVRLLFLIRNGIQWTFTIPDLSIFNGAFLTLSYIYIVIRIETSLTDWSQLIERLI